MDLLAFVLAIFALCVAGVSMMLASATADLVIGLAKDHPDLGDIEVIPSPPWLDALNSGLAKATRWAWIATLAVVAACVAIVLYRVVAP